MPPLELPPGDWELTLRTSWVEPAYLETDAAWCEPGGEPVGPLANGGAFGGKERSVVAAAARELADRHGCAVRVLLSREDSVRLGPKRPPIAAGVRPDGTGVVRVVRTEGVAGAIRSVRARSGGGGARRGRPTHVDRRARRGGGSRRRCSQPPSPPARQPGRRPPVPTRRASPALRGATAEAAIGTDGVVRVQVRCGPVLDPVVLRSYVIGAAHMALGWVTSEGLAVAGDGTVNDLTVRSFGVLRASEMPPVEVTLHDEEGEPVNGSDAVFAAVAAAAWSVQGWPAEWPTGRALLGGAVPQ